MQYFRGVLYLIPRNSFVSPSEGRPGAASFGLPADKAGFRIRTQGLRGDGIETRLYARTVRSSRPEPPNSERCPVTFARCRVRRRLPNIVPVCPAKRRFGRPFAVRREPPAGQNGRKCEEKIFRAFTHLRAGMFKAGIPIETTITSFANGCERSSAPGGINPQTGIRPAHRWASARPGTREKHLSRESAIVAHLEWPSASEGA